MCTAVSFRAADHYFGRNLDLYYHYNEQISIAPRRLPFRFRLQPEMPVHHAMIGMAFVVEGTPLFYEASNEKGLSAAGLNFPGNAVYHPEQPGMVNLGSFELIPWLLGQFTTVAEVREAAKNLNIADIHFSEQLPSSPLHWLVSDRDESIVLESTAEGLSVYDNPVHVLANNPPFPLQMFQLNNYAHLSVKNPEHAFTPALTQNNYCLGLGGLGLPGDLSSQSRFVRAAFVRQNALPAEEELQNVAQFFHILGSVCQQRGCSLAEENHYEYTIYSSCCNTDRGLYYYTTYDNGCIHLVDMNREDLDSDRVISYPMQTATDLVLQNG